MAILCINGTKQKLLISLWSDDGWQSLLVVPLRKSANVQQVILSLIPTGICIASEGKDYSISSHLIALIKA